MKVETPLLINMFWRESSKQTSTLVIGVTDKCRDIEAKLLQDILSQVLDVFPNELPLGFTT